MHVHVYVHVCTFDRALLRMVEGLQSRDSSVRSLTQAWVHSATVRGDLHRLIEPLVRIILEQNDKRRVFTSQSSNSELIEDSGKYYYSPAVTNADEIQLTQDEEIRLIYTQVYTCYARVNHRDTCTCTCI